MRVALYQPEIAGNVGAVMRLGACLGVAVDLIEPMGFAWDDRRVRRTAMDYVAVVERAWEAEFDHQRWSQLGLLPGERALALPRKFSAFPIEPQTEARLS